MDIFEDKRLRNIIATYGDASVESNWRFFTNVVVECNLHFFMKAACVQLFGHDNIKSLNQAERIAFMGHNKRVISLAVMIQEVDQNNGNSKTT